jgi:creatinine amidohydrolase
MRNWWGSPAVSELQGELFGDRDGSHATASEISVTQYACPEAIKRVPLAPPLAPPSSGFTDAADFRRRYPDGRIGSDPSLADPALGERLYHAAVGALSEDYRKFLAEP